MVKLNQKINLDWLGDNQRLFLERGYLSEGETPNQRFQTICNTINRICEKNGHFTKDNYSTIGIGNRFREYISKNWVSFSTPILSNLGTKKGLPISCNFGKISDSLDSILSGVHEIGMLAKYGAGTAKNFSDIRAIGESISTGGRSEGIIPWIELYSKAIAKVTQGTTRRGFLTAYLKITHPELESFLEIGGDGNDIQNITTAVTIPKGFMKLVKTSRKNFDLIQQEEIKIDIMEAKSKWASVLKSRAEKGYPYILFEENCNRNYPKVYEDKDMWIDSSNICIEAIEYCDEFKEFACCLSSVISYHFDDWKNDSNFIKDMIVMLDCVISEYIEKGKDKPGLEKAIRFAKEHRAVGLGVLGFHSYLQKNMISFGSLESFSINNDMFSLLRKEADKASKMMAEYWGEPEILKGYGERNTSKLAQAPTKSSSFITSPFKDGSYSEGIQPYVSNYNEKTLAKVQVEDRNPELKKLLISKSKNIKEVWLSILNNNGSVQHLDFLSEHEKEVFKTFFEISQVDVIKLAGQRQKYIDMGQSINVAIHPSATPKSVSELNILAFDSEVKSLYYQYSINAAQEFNKELMECSSCEG